MARQDSKFSSPSRPTLGGVRTQYAALCWRKAEKGLEVLLVTSRETGRWVIPKGWPIAGLSPEATAAQEAWEEAGAKGKIDPVCVGLFAYDKIMGPDRSVPCAVAVYALEVHELVDDFPERRCRRRKWLPINRAMTKVNEEELRAIMAAFQPSTLDRHPVIGVLDDDDDQPGFWPTSLR